MEVYIVTLPGMIVMGDMADLSLTTHASGFSKARRTNKTGNYVSPYVVSVTCQICEGSMTKKSGPYGQFWGCDKFPSCRGSNSIL